MSDSAAPRGSTEARGRPPCDVNTPVRLTPYVEALLSGGGVKKVDTGDGNTMRVNTVTGSGFGVLCAHCGVSKPRMACCSSCKRTPYCSKECQRSAWPDHKARCREMRATTSATGDGSNSDVHDNMKWLSGVPNFAQDLRRMIDAKPGRKGVPTFFVEGGSNPYVANVTEASDDQVRHRALLNAMPDMKHWLREDPGPLPGGRKRALLMIHRGDRVSMSRIQV
jgi:hypothetical protein